MALWNLKGKHILVVDDFAEMRSMMRSMVAAYGADLITQARNGEEALEKMEQQRFDIILCDYNLGDGKDGQQVLEEAKHRALLPYSTVFIMVTAENTQEMVMGALEYQPDAYLSKPVTKTVMQARLQKLMEKKESMQRISTAIEYKEYAKAIKLCDAAIEVNSKHRFELSKLQVELLITMGDYERAEAVCQSIIDERELPWALLNLGKVRFYQNQLEEADRLFERIIDMNPTFVAAYDWRARVQEKRGDSQAAQATLSEAVNQSPKSLLRQRHLADVADQNQDYATTEKARRRAVRVGRGSILREPRDFTAYAKVLIKNNSAKEALKVVDNIKHEFKLDPAAEVAAVVTGSLVQEALGRGDKAMDAIDQAMQLVEGKPGLIDPEVALDFARVCLANDRKDDADKIITDVIKNHYEEKELLDQISNVYDEAGFKAEADKMISDIAEAAVEINNQGVRLAKEGKLEESSEFFARAVTDMPKNPVVNLNAAQSLIMLMKSGSPTREQLERALVYISVADNDDGHRQWANKLRTICATLSSQVS